MVEKILYDIQRYKNLDKNKFLENCIQKRLQTSTLNYLKELEIASWYVGHKDPKYAMKVLSRM